MDGQSKIESKEIIGAGKILILGASGMVGQRFLELFDGTFMVPRSSELDLTNAEQVIEYMVRNKPKWVLNFAAFTDVTAAIKQRGDKNGSCWQVNVEGTRNLVNALPENTRLIHISTDMVFSGTSGPYKETDIPEEDPTKLTWYGFTKAEAERVIGNKGTIIRIIYPVRKKYDFKLDYLKKPLEMYRQNKLYPLFIDQQINITYIDELCMVLQKIITNRLTGVYHVASSDLTTPYDLITYYISKVENKQVEAQKSNVDPARYPKFGGLTVKMTEEKLGMKFSSWREIVAKL